MLYTVKQIAQLGVSESNPLSLRAVQITHLQATSQALEGHY